MTTKRLPQLSDSSARSSTPTFADYVERELRAAKSPDGTFVKANIPRDLRRAFKNFEEFSVLPRGYSDIADVERATRTALKSYLRHTVLDLKNPKGEALRSEMLEWSDRFPPSKDEVAEATAKLMQAVDSWSFQGKGYEGIKSHVRGDGSVDYKGEFYLQTIKAHFRPEGGRPVITLVAAD